VNFRITVLEFWRSVVGQRVDASNIRRYALSKWLELSCQFSSVKQARYYTLAITSKMSNAGLTTAHTLPRFLLPRLSWQSGAAGQLSLRALSTAAASQTYPQDPFANRKSFASLRTVTSRAYGTRSRILENLPKSRSFHATRRQWRDHHFDTLKFVQRLKEEGFTEEQSVAMMKVLSDVIEERCDHPCPQVLFGLILILAFKT
jgi:Protein of unknown function (DUF1640)